MSVVRDWDETLSDLERALTRNPLDPASCRSLADGYAVRGRLKDSVAAYLRLSDLLQQAGDLDNALQVASLVTRLKPDSVEARLRRVAIFEACREDAQALACTRELARIYIELGQGEEAIALLQRARRAHPEDLNLAVELAESLVGQGHLREAEAAYSEVAHRYLERGQLESAAEAFRRVKLLNCGDHSVLRQLSQIYTRLGRLAEAEQELRTILRHDLNDEEGLYGLGSVCQARGQFRDAILAFNRLLSLNPRHAEARQQLGQLYQVQGLAAEAVVHYLTAAELHKTEGRTGQAVALWHEVLRLDPGHPVCLRELTEIGAELTPPTTAEFVAMAPPPAVVAVPTQVIGLTKKPPHQKSVLLKPLPGPRPPLSPRAGKPVLLRPLSPDPFPTEGVNEAPIFCQSLPADRLREPAEAAEPMEPAPVGSSDVEARVPEWLVECPADQARPATGVGPEWFAEPAVNPVEWLAEPPVGPPVEAADEAARWLAEPAIEPAASEGSEWFAEPAVNGAEWLAEPSLAPLVANQAESSVVEADAAAPWLAEPAIEPAAGQGTEWFAEPAVNAADEAARWLVEPAIESADREGSDWFAESPGQGCEWSADVSSQGQPDAWPEWRENPPCDWLKQAAPVAEELAEWLNPPVTTVSCREVRFFPMLPTAPAGPLPQLAEHGRVWTVRFGMGRPQVDLQLESHCSAQELAVARQLTHDLSGLDLAAQLRAYRKAAEQDTAVLITVEAARVHLEAGMCAEAVAMYRMVLSRRPDLAGLHHRLIEALLWNEQYPEAAAAGLALARMHAEQGQGQDALDVLVQTLSLEPSHLPARQLLVEILSQWGQAGPRLQQLRHLAEQAAQQGQWQLALDSWRELYSARPQPLVLERLGWLSARLGRSSEACDCYRQLLDYFQSQQRWFEAAAICDRVLALRPGDLKLRRRQLELLDRLGWKERHLEQQLALAAACREQQLFGEAQETLRGLLAGHPEHRQALALMIDLQLTCQAYDEAVVWSDRLIPLYLAGGHLTATCDLLERLLHLQPEQASLRERLVRVYELAGQPESAVGHLQVLADQQGPAEAAASLERILLYRPDRLEVHLRLARLYLQLGDERAEACLQRAPRTPEVVQLLLNLWVERGQMQAAAELLQSHPEMRDELVRELRGRQQSEAHYRLGLLHYHQGDLDSAIERFQSTRRQPGYAARSYNMLGLCFARKPGSSMLELGIRQLRKGLELERDNPELRANLAELLERSGRLAEAVQEYGLAGLEVRARQAQELLAGQTQSA